MEKATMAVTLLSLSILFNYQRCLVVHVHVSLSCRSRSLHEKVATEIVLSVGARDVSTSHAIFGRVFTLTQLSH